MEFTLSELPVVWIEQERVGQDCELNWLDRFLIIQ